MKVGKQKLSMSESYKVRVDPSGPRDALVVFVGDAPAKEDIYQNAPFSGVDGEHLTNCCRLAGIDRRKVYITTLSKYRVKADKMANVPPEDIISMGQKMMEEINELPNVRIIVPLGKYALSTLTNKSGITNFRGSPLPPALGIRHDCVVVPTFHPGHLNAVYKDWVLMVADLTKVRRIMDNNYQFNWPKYEFILRPSYGEVMDTISMIKNLKPEFIAVDVETPKNLLSCIGIAWDRQNALCIPTMYGNGNSYWKIENEMKIWRALDDLFQTVPIGNQNIMFDWRILCQHGFQPMKAIKEGMLIRDPMLMHHCLYSEMRHGLDVIVSIYTDLPFFKKDEEEKKGSALIAGKETEHWTYNSMDCIGAYWAIEELEKELIDENMFDTYKNLYSDMIPVLFEMNMRGVPVDINYLETIRRESTELVSQYNARIKELTGEDVNVQSPKQVSHLLYDILKFQKYAKGATDKDTLEKLAYKYNSEIPQMIIDIRASKKELKLFDEENIIDGHIHCEYALHGTATGRLASRKGRGRGGMNLQNVKKGGVQRRFFIPFQGHVMMFADQQNAEARIVAWLANDDAMMGLFASGKSLHLENAKNILGYEITKSDPRYRVYKACVHGGNYGIGPRKFAMITGLDFSIAQDALNAYHERYPGIRKNFHTFVYEEIMAHRTLYNPFHRRQIFLEPLTMYGTPNVKVFQAGYAFIPQSTVSDINKQALKKIRKYYITLLETHDGIGISVPEGEVKYAYEAFQEAYDVRFKIWGQEHVVPIDVSYGPNWKDQIDIVIENGSIKELED